jgi:hypothetical protein
LSDQIEDVMVRACSTYGGKQRCIQGFGGETLGKETAWKNPSLDRRIILRWIFRSGMWGHGLDQSGAG